MDIVDRRLRQLEADYAATVAAGARDQQPPRPDDTSVDALDTPELENCDELLPVQIEGVKYEPREENPLTLDQIDQIKTHMKSIKLCHNPEWASELSDAQFARVFSNVFSRDNSG